MSEFGGLRKHENTKHALCSQKDKCTSRKKKRSKDTQEVKMKTLSNRAEQNNAQNVGIMTFTMQQMDIQTDSYFTIQMATLDVLCPVNQGGL